MNNNTCIELPTQPMAPAREEESSGYRLAQKAFHCHQCQTQFRQMVNVLQAEQVHCSQCGSEFVEEARSVSSHPVHPVQPAASPQPRSPSSLAPQSANSASYGRPVGFTRSVTISYSPQGEVTRTVETISSSA